MKAAVNGDICTGCQLCTQICPEVFKMQSDKSSVYQDPILESNQTKCKDASGQCPVSAISITN